MAYTVTIRDILFNTDTVACACLLLKAGTLGLRSQPKQQVVLVCQLKFDQLTNTVNRLVKRIYTMQEMDIKTWRHFKHENLLFQTLMCLQRSCRKVLLTREWMSIMHHWDLICQHGPDVHPHNKSQHLQKSCGDWVKKSKLGFCSYSHQRRVCRQGGAAFHISDPHNQSARQSGGKTNHKSLLQSPLKIPCGYALCQWSSRM